MAHPVHPGIIESKLRPHAKAFSITMAKDLERVQRLDNIIPKTNNEQARITALESQICKMIQRLDDLEYEIKNMQKVCILSRIV
jgi:TolA-binding protein